MHSSLRRIGTTTFRTMPVRLSTHLLPRRGRLDRLGSQGSLGSLGSQVSLGSQASRGNLGSLGSLVDQRFLT